MTVRHAAARKTESMSNGASPAEDLHSRSG